MTQQGEAIAVEQLFAGGGETGAIMRSLDWSRHPLGAVEQWPQSLKTTVRIMLTSRQPMFVWWGEQLINLYNDAYKSIVGGKHPKALGQPASEVWHEIWDQVGPRAESAMLKNEGTYDEALLLIMERNGYPEETYYTFSYSLVPNDQGGTGGIICANTDDTQRIIGERQLALLRELAAKTADARTFDDACTRSAKCLETNPYDLPFAMIYLVDPGQECVVLAGTSGIERNHPAIPERISLDSDSPWPFAEAIATHKPCLVADLEALFGNLPTGAWQRPPHQAVIVPIAASGQTGQAGILIVGLNPFRLFDDNYSGFIDLVAAQIAASIANAQAYEEERKRAEALAELDRAKTIFFSNISHEFRTPLTLMLSPLEEMLTNSAGLLPSEREHIETAHRNSLRLLKLVNTLLDFSRIEAGRVQAVYEPTDLAMFTADLAGMFRSAIEQAGMRLGVDCPPLPEPVYVDREMWEKIVLNLLSNAFKFTWEGEITVALRWADEHVELEVRDTGTGIPAEAMPHLFERFHRVEGARGRTYEGSGIGLSLVQELVKLHGGTIQVSSVVNRGSCFTVLIPTGYAHIPKERISTPRTLGSTAMGAATYVEEALRWLPEEESRGSRVATEVGGELSFVSSCAPLLSCVPSAHILLADDNADMRDYVKRLLVSQGYEVETVGDGVAALASIAQQLPDLVLTDVMMPRLDGLELLRSLRDDPRTREIPIILLSARAGEESRIEGMQAGADDYLIKPFSAREMLARVEATLKLAQMRQEATRREEMLRAEVQSAKEALENLLSRIEDQFLALDQDWRYIYANDRVVEVTGKSREELLGKSIWELYPDTIGTQFQIEVQRAVTEQIPIQFEYFYPSLSRWFENRIYPSSNGLSMFVADITDRKQAEEALRQALQKLNFHVENTPMAVVEWDRDFRIIRWSAAAERILGWKAEEIMGKQLTELRFVYEEDAQAVAELCRRLVYGEEPHIFGYNRNYTKNGDIVHCEWYNSSLRDEFGRMTSVLSLVLDVTERKQAEQEREQLLKREQAARADSEAARSAAEAANRIKDEFLAVLSHELRSPLNPILGWSRLLQTRKFDAAKTTEALATIERNAKLQAELIEDLLDVSRILQGKLSLNITPVALTSTIQAAMETVRLAAEAKSIQIYTKLKPQVGIVSGDASRLQQVVWNLLSNAIKFTPQGGQIDIRLECIGSQAQITVSDTGKGIPVDFLPYVFDYFRQGDATTTRKFGGLGLGLAIVRHLVELHGGTVQADSAGEGQGATFTVRIPLLLSQPQSDRDSQQPELSLDLQGVEILVVDDDVDTREFVAFLLEQYGAKVRTVGSAGEALAALTQSVPDVLLSDIGMPDVDGYMLMQKVRTLAPEQGGQIPAIALSAYAGEINYQQALSAGFQTHLSKPVDPDKLVALVTKLAQLQ